MEKSGNTRYKEETWPNRPSRTFGATPRLQTDSVPVSLCTATPTNPLKRSFLANFGNQFPVLRPLLSRIERRSEALHGIRINYAAAYGLRR